MQTSYNAEKVAVTVNLTVEAAKILRQYAGERNRGRFLSDLIMEQRRRDDLERQAVAAAAVRSSNKPVEAAEVPAKPVEAAVRAQQPHQQPRHSKKSRKGR